MTPWILLAGWYAAASLAAFITYWKDKRAAERATQRVPERTLHALEALGGWPGALIAQRILRHKTRDPRFQAVFWAIVILHAVALGLCALR
jgi:uncharacterized membrane protein YsdA (DUF1294 family)